MLCNNLYINLQIFRISSLGPEIFNSILFLRLLLFQYRNIILLTLLTAQMFLLSLFRKGCVLYTIVVFVKH